MHLRSTRRVRSEVSLYDPIGVDKEGNELTTTLYLYCPQSLVLKGCAEIGDYEKQAACFAISYMLWSIYTMKGGDKYDYEHFEMGK